MTNIVYKFYFIIFLGRVQFKVSYIFNSRSIFVSTNLLIHSKILRLTQQQYCLSIWLFGNLALKVILEQMEIPNNNSNHNRIMEFS